MNKLLITLILINLSFAKQYTNCSFKNKDYEDICKELKLREVSIQYTNKILLSKKAKKINKTTLKMLNHKKRNYIKKKESKSNKNNINWNNIKLIKKHLKEYKETYDLSERIFPINREIIAATLMKETSLGKFKLKHKAFESLNTILLKTKPDSKRNKWLKRLAKSNIISLIEFCHDNKIPTWQCNFKSSYMGAIGYAQFMPENLYLALSFSGEKYTTLNNINDSIISIANYYEEIGLMNKKIDFKKLSLKEIQEGKSEKVKNILTKIKKYNNSTIYAKGILSIAYLSWKN